MSPLLILIILIYLTGIVMFALLYKTTVEINYTNLVDELKQTKKYSEEKIKRRLTVLFYVFSVAWPIFLIKLIIVSNNTK